MTTPPPPYVTREQAAQAVADRLAFYRENGTEPPNTIMAMYDGPPPENADEGKP